MSSVSALERCWPLILCSSVHLGLSDRVSVPSLNGSYSPHPFLQGPTLLSTATAKSHCVQSTYCVQAPFLAFTHRKHCEMVLSSSLILLMGTVGRSSDSSRRPSRPVTAGYCILLSRWLPQPDPILAGLLALHSLSPITPNFQSVHYC